MFGFRHLEHKTAPLAPRPVFLRRVWWNFLYTLGVVAFSLALGTCGYCHFGQLSWVDGLLTAAMILTGMGPVDRMETTGGKLFSSFYALYSGLAFLTMIAVLMAPIYHRLLHRFHLEAEEEPAGGAK